jgi:hypothetical protein
VIDSDEQLTQRAFAAYFRSAAREGSLSPAQPANYSGVEEYNGKRYVVLRNVRGILAVYRVRNDGVLKGLRRWPKTPSAGPAKTTTATRVRRADCPPWCASDHRGTDPDRPASHFSPAASAADGKISVCAALLTGSEEPEVILDHILRPAARTGPGSPPAWVRLSPSQAVNLAAILDTAGHGELAALIRQAAGTLAQDV